jgi:acetyl-CoA carboxylase biotin carboxyl carrier protein
MDLTQDDVIHILKLIDEAPLGRVNLQYGDFKLEVMKGDGWKHSLADIPPAAAPAPAVRAAPPPSGASETVAPAAAAATVDDNLPKIIAPILGIFYRRPQPGAPAYVEEGSLVEEDTTVALIEVMKLFNPVKAGRRGRIHRVCAENGQLVEYGHTLFLLQPE